MCQFSKVTQHYFNETFTDFPLSSCTGKQEQVVQRIMCTVSMFFSFPKICDRKRGWEKYQLSSKKHFHTQGDCINLLYKKQFTRKFMI